MQQTPPETGNSIRLMLGGDVMLGRTVKEYIERYGYAYPLGPVSDLMRQADLTVVNLECAITASDKKWTGAPKAFYFGAPPDAARSLAKAGVDMVSLANNHTLDYGVTGLQQTLHFLREQDIRHAGAGRDLAEASRGAVIERNGIRVGMVSFCDHQADFAARRDAAGIAYLNLGDEAAVMKTWRGELASLRQNAVHWPMLSLHWGPNMVWRPSEKFRRLAHAAIDMGWKIVFGHSAHVFHGLEIYRDCPILYSAGDLVDDYCVDPEFNNDHQLLIELELTLSAMTCVRLYPVFIENCQVRPAAFKSFEYIAERIGLACAEMATHVHHQGKMLWIEGRAAR